MTGLRALRRVPAGLTVRRSWPHRDGLAVEATATDGLIVGLLITDDEVRVLASEDPALPALAPALARPGTVLLGHRPGRRAVLREADGSYLKIVRAGRGHRVADGLREAAGRLHGIPGAPLVPAVLDADPAAGWVRLAEIPGPSLHTLLQDAPADAARFCRAVATASTALRAAPVGGLARHDAGDEVDLLHRWIADAEAYSDVRLAEAAQPVTAALRALPEPRWVACHRDLHDKQLVDTPPAPTVGLLDLDTLCSADPALDAANLLAHLHLRTLQGRCGPDTARDCALALHDPGLDPGAVRTWTAAALLRLAAVYTFRPDPLDLPARLAAATTDPVPSTWRIP
ncbi:aminoglycoside phosphotransferase family protein [Pseudonocardia nigra]|uniref:aminoglycoside phosphotransferase family protein n=1 Tax=Pseudonocardia nigra TaxID=1921578 RepID=UPI001C5D1728|nr:aminoglycoside phosphotransferase family protein [Pseudonocardia nigra]